MLEFADPSKGIEYADIVDDKLIAKVKNQSRELDFALIENQLMIEENNITLLHIMSFLGLADIVEQVIEAAPDNLDKEAAFKVTALHLAEEAGHLEVVRVLIENNVNVDVNNYARGTPLIVASANGHVDVVAELLQAGADINEVNSSASQDHWTEGSEPNIEGQIENIPKFQIRK